MPEGLASQTWKLTEYGVAGIVLAVVLVFTFALVWWVLKQQEKLLKDTKEERTRWFELFLKFTSSLDQHTVQAKEFHDRQNEANRYVRDEHLKMVECLNGLTSELKFKPCLADKR